MLPIRLSDDELDAVFAAARPIPVDRRDRFLQQVASLLTSNPEPGPGDVYRAIATAQRAHFDPPDLTRERSEGWGHSGQPKPGRPPRQRGSLVAR